MNMIDPKRDSQPQLWALHRPTSHVLIAAVGNDPPHFHACESRQLDTRTWQISSLKVSWVLSFLRKRKYETLTPAPTRSFVLVSLLYYYFLVINLFGPCFFFFFSWVVFDSNPGPAKTTQDNYVGFGWK